MRILLLTQYFAPEVGASQVRLSAFAKELRAAGHQVEVVTAMPHHPAGSIFSEYQGRFYCRETREGMVVHRVWLFAAMGSGAKRIANYLSFAILCLYGLARAEKPDLVFADSPPLFLGLPAWLATRGWRVPFVFNVADLWPDSVRDLGVMKEGPILRVAAWLEKWIYKHADFVTAVTAGIRDVLLSKKRVPPERVLFLPNGVDTNFFRPMPPDIQLSRELGLEGKKIVLYAGNHGYAGGVEQLVEAAALISDPSIHFLLIGDGPEKPALRKLAKKLRLTNITFMDAVPLEELPAFLSIADLAAVTLRRAKITEGARPAKTFVMMAAGKPIVLAANGESVELVRSAEAGMAVPPHAPGELAEAIRFLLDNPKTAARMGANAREYVVRHFDWSLLVRDWLAELREKSTKKSVPGRAYAADSGTATPL